MKAVWGSIPFLFLFFMASAGYSADGMINVPSDFSVEDSADRAAKILETKGMTIFARISHSANAKKVGLELRETELLVFGNPKVGSPLMRCGQTVAIDLPQKFLFWQDANQEVWISYNDPRYLARRHQIEGCEKVLAKIENALAGIAAAAAGNAPPHEQEP